VQEAFLATGIRLFSFSVDNPVNRPIPEYYSKLKEFQYLMSDSGGFALNIPSNSFGTPEPLVDKSG
jgi:hypothetical protein